MPRPARLTPPTSPDSAPPRIHRRLTLLPREAGRTTDGAFSCTGAPAAHPHLRAHASLPSLSAYIRNPALADGLATQGAARVHCQTRRRAISRPTMAKSATRPIRLASLPAAPRPSGLPLADIEKPAPQGDLGMRAQKAGAGSYLSYFFAALRRATLALMQSTMPTARTPTIAVTQAAKSPKCRAGIPMSRPTT